MCDQFTDISLKFCIDYTEKLINHPLTTYFRDPPESSIPDYKKVIERPISLKDIKKKFDNNEYKNISEWRSDVTLIWENAISYHSKNGKKKSSYALKLAETLKQKTDNSLIFVPSSELELIQYKMIKICKKMRDVMEFKAFRNAVVLPTEENSINYKGDESTVTT